MAWINLGPDRCAVCRKPSESSAYCCNRCMDDPLWLVILRHPVRAQAIGWLHMFSRAPGDVRL